MLSLLGALTRANADAMGAADSTRTVARRWSSMLAVLLAMLAPAAYAADVRVNPYAELPLRKPGLWEVTIQAHAPAGMGGRMQSAMTALQCTDASAERVVPFFLLPAREDCRRITVSKGARGGHDVSTVCASHGQRVDTQVHLKGDMQARYDGTYRIRHPDAPSSDTGTVPISGRWLGRCKAGQRAGDMVLPNGITVNPVDDAHRARGHAH
ncbi:DUF3617 domain-containing protein [Pseudoxanthomonas sp. LH2527]|uniref:DUF3617 domain-containing protein n=1 Tax=Pseudoxanthomonas sp. LH2527 TaxID=2923249 RepID=UPI001F1344F7|nr:DUF3617 family protein [Pseudoxanthomonas sp. LH2527]MCH6483821.1 DUF3617 domain-containing protein [Pseudoxanthomonas sp. LH2527]